MDNRINFKKLELAIIIVEIKADKGIIIMNITKVLLREIYQLINV